MVRYKDRILVEASIPDILTSVHVYGIRYAATITILIIYCNIDIVITNCDCTLGTILLRTTAGSTLILILKELNQVLNIHSISR